MSATYSYWTLRNRYSPPLQRCHIERETTADAARLAGMCEGQPEEQQPAPEGTQGAPQEPQTGESQTLPLRKKVT